MELAKILITLKSKIALKTIEIKFEYLKKLKLNKFRKYPHKDS